MDLSVLLDFQENVLYTGSNMHMEIIICLQRRQKML